MKMVLARQCSDLVFLLEWRKANCAAASHEFFSCDYWQALQRLRTSCWLCNHLVEPEQQVVIVGSDISGKQVEYLHRGEATRQTRVGSRPSNESSRPPAAMIAVPITVLVFAVPVVATVPAWLVPTPRPTIASNAGTTSTCVALTRRAY